MAVSKEYLLLRQFPCRQTLEYIYRVKKENAYNLSWGIEVDKKGNIVFSRK